jgi:two-component system nitrogen regulation sensor histidine kinase NtrY
LLERRNYIETVLQSLSTGVVSIDDTDRITTVNASAARMLGLGNRPHSGRLLSEVIGTDDWTVINRLLRRARRAGHAAEQTQLESGANGAGPLPVAMTATALTNSVFSGRGAVLVIEDLSELLAAQRVAAWSEVARRMAHEIKNPLTPIQLSAERIAKNYKRVASANGQNGSDQIESLEVDKVGAVIAECTETISREVAALKAMVDEFSRFARLPAIQLESANLNEVITQAIGLYEERLDDATISAHLSPELGASMLDVEQIKRVFVNLIDNALDALIHADNEKRITIVTYHDTERSLLVAEVADTGHGIEPNDFKRLFQPYFSRRDSGTGLGLAIVQRIVLEHHGRIRAEKNHPTGAKFIIELPAAT